MDDYGCREPDKSPITCKILEGYLFCQHCCRGVFKAAKYLVAPLAARFDSKKLVQLLILMMCSCHWAKGVK